MYWKHCAMISLFNSEMCDVAYFKTLLELLLLLVDYPETEVDLVGLFEVRLHAHNLRKGFLGMLKRSVPIVQNANTVPQFWFLSKVSIESREYFMRRYHLWIGQVIQCLLIRRVGLLQVIHHEVAMACGKMGSITGPVTGLEGAYQGFPRFRH
jgi:hypothetical protein